MAALPCKTLWSVRHMAALLLLHASCGCQGLQLLHIEPLVEVCRPLVPTRAHLPRVQGAALIGLLLCWGRCRMLQRHGVTPAPVLPALAHRVSSQLRPSRGCSCGLGWQRRVQHVPLAVVTQAAEHGCCSKTTYGSDTSSSWRVPWPVWFLQFAAGASTAAGTPAPRRLLCSSLDDVLSSTHWSMVDDQALGKTITVAHPHMQPHPAGVRHAAPESEAASTATALLVQQHGKCGRCMLQVLGVKRSERAAGSTQAAACMQPRGNGPAHKAQDPCWLLPLGWRVLLGIVQLPEVKLLHVVHMLVHNPLYL